jgi:hypothetical protein
MRLDASGETAATSEQIRQALRPRRPTLLIAPVTTRCSPVRLYAVLVIAVAARCSSSGWSRTRPTHRYRGLEASEAAISDKLEAHADKLMAVAERLRQV